MVNLVQQELILLSTTIIERVKQVQQGPETGYAVMRTEMEFFNGRSAVMPVIAWLEMRGSFMPERNVCEGLGINTSSLDDIDAFSVRHKITYGMYFNWVSMISASICKHSKSHGFSEEQMYEALKQCFNYIQRGVTSGNILQSSGGINSK